MAYARLEWDPQFETTSERQRADIIVWFEDVELVECDSTVRAAGCGAFGSAESPGVVYLAMRLGGEFTPYGVLRELAKHEFGHAIGFDHSELAGALMFPEGDEIPEGAHRPGWQRRAMEFTAIAGGAAIAAVVIVRLRR